MEYVGRFGRWMMGRLMIRKGSREILERKKRWEMVRRWKDRKGIEKRKKN